LHAARRGPELDPRAAPRDDGLDVAPYRADGAGHHADAQRRGRERALALHREEALGRQAPLQRLEPQVRVAEAGGPEIVDAQLDAALAVIELNVPVRLDLRAVARG